MSVKQLNSNVISLVTKIPDEYKIKFLRLALMAWQYPGKNCHHIVQSLSKDIGLSKAQTLEITGVFIIIIKLFLQNSYKDFKTELTEIGFSTDFISNLSLAENETDLISKLQEHSYNYFNRIKVLKWRIDLTGIDSVIQKKVPKPVILCIILNNGQKYTIKVEAHMFHKLRFNVALLLKELISSNSYTNKAQAVK